MRNIIVLLFMLLASAVHAVTYTKADSIKVVTLLTQAAKEKPKNLMLYFGKKLEGVPYVAHTLEVNKKEQLVINMREMDCTTFVETVLALSMTTKQGRTSFADFCTNLETIRYRNGKVDGYVSRNHYFKWWADNNATKGIVTDVLKGNAASKTSYRRKQTINVNYMSTHSAAYAMLKGNKKDIATIASYEKATKGQTMWYIQPTYVGLSQSKLSFIHDGDILALATNKKGLDTTHIGIAFWGKDGKLHLLNASQVHKKVVFEPMTLKQYMAKHPVQIGIWVLHPTVLD